MRKPNMIRTFIDYLLGEYSLAIVFWHQKKLAKMQLTSSPSHLLAFPKHSQSYSVSVWSLTKVLQQILSRFPWLPSFFSFPVQTCQRRCSPQLGQVSRSQLAFRCWPDFLGAQGALGHRGTSQLRQFLPAELRSKKYLFVLSYIII